MEILIIVFIWSFMMSICAQWLQCVSTKMKLTLTVLLGNMLFHICKWKNLRSVKFGVKFEGYSSSHKPSTKPSNSKRKSTSIGSSVSCSYNVEKDVSPTLQQLVDARVIYSVSPAMGHNKVNFSIIIIWSLISHVLIGKF